MNTILFNEDTGLLRSGWRAAIFLFAFVLAAVFLGSMGQGVVILLKTIGYESPAVFFTTGAIFSLIPTILVGWLSGKFLERLPYRALGASLTKGWSKHFILGLIGGSLALAMAAGIGMAVGSFRFVANDASMTQIVNSAAVSFGVFAVAAAFEEAFFHGYLLQTFVRSNLRWFGVLLTSILFGVAHTDNPSANLISTANTILAGVWFGVAYLRTRDLWFVWGLHLMWNWMQGSFFGIEVSGLTDITTNPIFKEIDFGPTWLTGQAYGIEGGILCTVAILISIGIVYLMPGLTPDEAVLAANTREDPEQTTPLGS
ncbi:MAG: type II CAAX endopeptidase family protein [Pyrinomonadaceae bacterium]